MTYAIFFGGFVLGTLAGLFLAGLLGAAHANDYDAYHDGWVEGRIALMGEMCAKGESCRVDMLGGE